MDYLEKVERLRQRANVTYEEAKAALDGANGDLLDAIIALEKTGKVAPPANGLASESYRTGSGSGGYAGDCSHEPPNQSTFGDMVRRFVRFLGRLIRKGSENTLEVVKGGEVLASVPVIVFVVLLFVCFWVVLPLMVVSLFFGWTYRFRGPHLEKDQINGPLNKASEYAETMMKDFKREFKRDSDGDFENNNDSPSGDSSEA